MSFLRYSAHFVCRLGKVYRCNLLTRSRIRLNHVSSFRLQRDRVVSMSSRLVSDQLLFVTCYEYLVDLLFLHMYIKKRKLSKNKNLKDTLILQSFLFTFLEFFCQGTKSVHL